VVRHDAAGRGWAGFACMGRPAVVCAGGWVSIYTARHTDRQQSGENADAPLRRENCSGLPHELVQRARLGDGLRPLDIRKNIP
jgi:hypothetical protein